MTLMLHTEAGRSFLAWYRSWVASDNATDQGVHAQVIQRILRDDVPNDPKEVAVFKKFLYDIVLPFAVGPVGGAAILLGRKVFLREVRATFKDEMDQFAVEFLRLHPFVYYKGFFLSRPLRPGEQALEGMAQAAGEDVWHFLQKSLTRKFRHYINASLNGFYDGWTDPGEKSRLEAAPERGMARRAAAHGKHNLRQWPYGEEPLTTMLHGDLQSVPYRRDRLLRRAA